MNSKHSKPESFLNKKENAEERSAGQESLEYSYKFPGGERFEVVKKENGEFKVSILKDKKVIFDFSSLLPSEWKLVSRDYISELNKKTSQEIPWLEWWADHRRKLIQIGKFKIPQDLLGFFHEIGHVKNNHPKDLETLQKLEDSIHDETLPVAKDKERVDFRKEQVRLTSKIERQAWAYSLMLLKKMDREFGLDTKSLFPKFAQLRSYINKDLAAYRQEFKQLVDEFKFEPTFYQELEKLFDRKQD